MARPAPLRAPSPFTLAWAISMTLVALLSPGVSRAAGISKSGDLGFTTGTYEDSYDGDGGQRVHEVGKYVCVWRRQKDGSWKAIHDTWNSDAK